MKLELFGFKFKALGGPNELQFYAEDRMQAEALASQAIALVAEIEQRYSRYRDDSIVARINAQAGGQAVAVDDETAGLFDYAAALFAQSSGLFDITSGVLRRVWDFKAHKIPTQDEINAILPLVGWQKVEWRKPLIRLPLAGMQLDLGGIGKEFAVDRVSALLFEKGVRHGLVNLGGDTRSLGPHLDGSPWIIGVVHPREKGEALRRINMYSGALATSGDYERYFEKGGRRYSHILDARSGWPVESFQSVSVLAELCLVAGSVSTVAMLLGPGKGLAFLKASGLSYIVVDANGEVISGLRQ